MPVIHRHFDEQPRLSNLLFTAFLVKYLHIEKLEHREDVEGYCCLSCNEQQIHRSIRGNEFYKQI